MGMIISTEKIILIMYFVTKKDLFGEKEKIATQCMQTWKATCTLWPVCLDGRAFTEGKRKLGEGEVRTTDEHRILPVGFHDYEECENSSHKL